MSVYSLSVERRSNNSFHHKDSLTWHNDVLDTLRPDLEERQLIIVANDLPRAIDDVHDDGLIVVYDIELRAKRAADDGSLSVGHHDSDHPSVLCLDPRHGLIYL